MLEGVVAGAVAALEAAEAAAAQVSAALVAGAVVVLGGVAVAAVLLGDLLGNLGKIKRGYSTVSTVLHSTKQNWNGYNFRSIKCYH